MLLLASAIQNPKSKIQNGALLALLCVLLPLSAFAAPARQVPPVQGGEWTHSEVGDWLPGTFSNTFVEGSVLRLQDGQSSGEYVSAPLQSPYGINAALVEWAATSGPDQSLTVDLRASIDGVSWDEWQRAEAVAQRDAAQVSQLLVLRPFTSYLQYRVGFTGQGSAPALDTLTLRYLSSTTGPRLTEIVGRVPLVGPPTLTPAPEAVARAEWAGAAALPAGERQQPQRVQLDQILAPVDDPNPLATLRALRAVNEQLFNQPELPYHYLIDGQGTLYEARGSVTQRIPDVEAGTVRIGVLANAAAEGVSEAAQARLIDLLGWLVASYGIRPAAIVGADAAPQQLKDVAVELRPRVERAVVRFRAVFAEGGTDGPTERLALFNPGPVEASATLGAYLPAGEERRSVVVPPGRRVDVTLNTTLPQTATVGLEVQADRRLLAERTIIAGRELLSSAGADAPARTWYFGAGETVSDTQTTLLVLNPARQEVAATLVFYPDGIAPVTETATFAPRSRTTLRLNEIIPDSNFGLKLVASQPVVAERTMTRGTGAAHLATGVAQLSKRWSFAEGSTEGVQTVLYLLNPWPQQVAVSLQVMSEDGTFFSRRYALPATARFVLPLNDVVPALPFAMELRADRPVAAEREMLFDDGTVGTATPGAPALATRWTFVEGSTAVPAQQFLLIANPNRESARLDIAYILADGTVERREHSIPSMARLTISANDEVPDQPTLTTIITASRPVAAERSIFVAGPDGRGAETSVGAAGD